jgi:hypothetical protein
MLKRLRYTILAVALAVPGGALADDVAEVDAVKAVVTSAYVEGVHRKGDPALMRAGFHPDFRMYTLRDGKVGVVSLDEWAERIGRSAQERKGPAPAVEAKFTQVDLTGSTAVARVEVYRDRKHVFTDYLSLYKLPAGWRIVAKTFQSH